LKQASEFFINPKALCKRIEQIKRIRLLLYQLTDKIRLQIFFALDQHA